MPVITSPFSQRRAYTARSYDALARGAENISSIVAQGLFQYQQEKELEKQQKIAAYNDLAKQFGGFSKLPAADVQDYERLKGVSLPRDAAGNLVKTQQEQMQDALGPMTPERAQVQAGLVQPAPNPAMVQAAHEKQQSIDLRYKQREENKFQLQTMKGDQAMQRALVRARIASDSNYRNDPSGFGLYKGKEFPWDKIKDKPGATSLSVGGRELASKSAHYSTLDDKTRASLNTGIDHLLADVKQSTHLRQLTDTAVKLEKAGNYKQANLIYSSVASAAMKASGASDEEIQKALSNNDTVWSIGHMAAWATKALGMQGQQSEAAQPTNDQTVVPVAPAISEPASQQAPDVDQILKSHGY